MSFISRFIARWRRLTASGEIDRDPRRSFVRQIELEREGRRAASAGIPRESSPYPIGSFGWQHWTFGHDLELAPRMIRRDGTPVAVSTETQATWPNDYLLRYPDGRVTEADGRPAVITPSSL
jgi:hypothetical protein